MVKNFLRHAFYSNILLPLMREHFRKIWSIIQQRRKMISSIILASGNTVFIQQLAQCASSQKVVKLIHIRIYHSTPLINLMHAVSLAQPSQATPYPTSPWPSSIQKPHPLNQSLGPSPSAKATPIEPPPSKEATPMKPHLTAPCTYGPTPTPTRRTCFKTILLLIWLR